jgi:hypothetical protein
VVEDLLSKENKNLFDTEDGIVYSRTLAPELALHLKQERAKHLNFVQSYRNKWEEADCLLVSFPKCGSSWFRYCVEQISRRPTIGDGLLDENDTCLGCVDLPLLQQLDSYQYDSDSPILAKTHMPPHNNHKKMILIVRNYKEVLSRPILDNKEYSKSNFKMTMEQAFIRKDEYFSLLDFFDKFENDKLMIFYEDLIQDFQREMGKVVSFLNLREEDLNNFVKDYDLHKKTSIDMYTRSPTISLSVAVASDKVSHTDVDFASKRDIKYPLVFPPNQEASVVKTKHFNPHDFKHYDLICPLGRAEYFYDYNKKIIFILLDLGLGSDAVLIIKELKEKYNKNLKAAKLRDPKAPCSAVYTFPAVKFLEDQPEPEDNEYVNAIYSGLALEVRYSEPYSSHSANSKELRFHSKKLLSKKECIAVDNFLEKKDKVLYNKYLARYREEA